MLSLLDCMFTVCSHCCSMGVLHSIWQPSRVILTVWESWSHQEPLWTWLTMWVSDTKLTRQKESADMTKNLFHHLSHDLSLPSMTRIQPPTLCAFNPSRSSTIYGLSLLYIVSSKLCRSLWAKPLSIEAFICLLEAFTYMIFTKWLSRSKTQYSS